MTQKPRSKCTYCDALAEPHGIVAPPLCLEHLDIVLLVEHLDRRGRRPTVRAAQDLMAQALANGGTWTITSEKLERLLPQFLAKQKEIANA